MPFEAILLWPEGEWGEDAFVAERTRGKATNRGNTITTTVCRQFT
ncbi:MAG TPA: hypothetical protein PK156_28175 [Polyangium sp.]|nr:hypothetical protein [Polyangium sp.]